MRNLYNYDDELGLVVTQTASKSLADVNRVIADNRPQKGIDSTIKLYLESTEPNNAIADDWYEQHLLVETLDPNEVITRTTTDDNGDEVVETLPNNHKVALDARTALEDDNDWLRGYRGLSAPERPELIADVDAWKLINKSLFISNVLDGLTIDMHGTTFQANETSQQRIIGKMSGMQRRGEVECVWRDAFNENVTLTLPQLEQLADAIENKLEQLILM